MSTSPQIKAALAALDTQLEAIEADVQVTLDQKDQTITVLNDTNAYLTQGLTMANAEKAALQAEYDAYRAAHPGTIPPPVEPPPVEPPPARKFLTGACPDTTVAAVGQEFGPTYVLREFDGAKGMAMVFERPADCDLLIGSVKLGALPTDAQWIKMLGTPAKPIFRDGDMICPNHEWDVKHLKALADGDTTAEAKRLATQQLNTAVHRQIVRLREAKQIPMVYTLDTLAIWRFSGGAQSPNLYLHEADYLGVDADGTTTQEGSSYPDWASTTILANIVSFVKAGKFKGWIAPEWGWPQLKTDTTGAKRIAAIRTQLPKFIQAGCLAAAWFNNDSKPEWKGYVLLPNEVTVWKSFGA